MWFASIAAIAEKPYAATSAADTAWAGMNI